MGGCGFVAGFGNTFRGGIEKKRPSNVYSVSFHMCRNCGTTSSNISLVISGSTIPKPRCSVDEEPRPSPNSKRPPDKMSRIATRSATRAGWFTGGVMLKMPLPPFGDNAWR